MLEHVRHAGEMEDNRLALLVHQDTSLTHDWAKVLVQSGYRALELREPSQAIEVCKTECPDLVVIASFFNKSDGRLSAYGALLFCTHLQHHCVMTGQSMPRVIGVANTSPSGRVPFDPFAMISKNIMPARFLEPCTGPELRATVTKLCPSEVQLRPSVRA